MAADQARPVLSTSFTSSQQVEQRTGSGDVIWTWRRPTAVVGLAADSVSWGAFGADDDGKTRTKQDRRT